MTCQARPVKMAPMEINGVLIKALREERGWTQQELVFHSGVSLSTVIRIENGRNLQCHRRTFHRFAGVFGVPVESLYLEGVAA